MNSLRKLELVREFWNEAPCDGQANYRERAKFRYSKDPWVKLCLERIANAHSDILEVGCGQGTDGVTLCQILKSDGQYTGVDMSEVSINVAREAAKEMRENLKVKPVFQVENAEQLRLPDNSFECVISYGALHHTESTEGAMAEVFRVLKPGGTAYIFLYRRLSPKLLVAHFLRALQRSVDFVLRTDRIFYKFSRLLNLENWVGTAVSECFGVQILRSFTRSGMLSLFQEFSSINLTAYGVGLPPIGINYLFDTSDGNPLGYLWQAKAVK